MDRKLMLLFVALLFGSTLTARAAPADHRHDHWNGFFLGGNAGYGWGSANATTTAPPFASSSFKTNNHGVLGGLQAGYNWLLGPHWLTGFEADIQAANQSGNATDAAESGRYFEAGFDFYDVFTRTATTDVKLPWFATFRGRIGYLADPLTLLYGTGGLALGRIELSSSVNVACTGRFNAFNSTPAPLPCIPPAGAPATGSSSFSDGTMRAGWTIGGGIERKISADWSLKLEYLYIDFGSHTFLAGTGNDTSVRTHDNVMRLGINRPIN